MTLDKSNSITDTVLADFERRSAAINTPMRDILADAGIDWSTWWRWKQGKSSPTLGTLSRVTKALEKREAETPSLAA
jgi:DNA-binding phage protein